MPGIADAIAWFRLLHPFPSLLVAVTGLGFASVASPHSLAPELAARLVCMLAASQFGVGAFNEYCDADLDAIAKPYRPIPSGRVPRRGALLTAIGLIVATMALAASFGPLTVAFGILGTGAGLAYDAVLKRTPWSWAPYVLGLPVLPLWAWSTLGELPPAARWAYPFGALLALALHVSNALPDERSDRAGGVKGLVELVGRQTAFAIMSLSFGLAVTSGIVIDFSSPEPVLVRLAALLGGAVGLAAVALASRPATDRAAFPLLAIGGALLAIGVAAALLGR